MFTHQYLMLAAAPIICCLRGRLQRTSGKWGGGDFEISDITGRGRGVVCQSSDVQKFLKKIEIPKLKIIIDRDSNMRAFT